MTDRIQFRNPFLNTYLEYVEETESPRIFHIWAALQGVAACMGRRVYLPFGGIGDIYPNMYTLLVGPPAVKKSTAMSIMRRLLKAGTAVRFMPDDTAGQRQGMISAMQGEEEEGDLFASLEATDAASFAALADNAVERLSSLEIDTRDRHSMFVCASEFNTFIGHNNIDVLTFLIKMWDGDDYEYKLKTSTMRLDQPLLNLIGGTTPTAINEAMPAAAIGQGFMSRVILVHSNEKYKMLPRPRLREDLQDRLSKTYSIIFNMYNGPLEESDEAREYVDSLYGARVDINDPRFVYYIDRRHIHLIKLSMNLAAARCSQVIELQDVQEANVILRATEIAMPDALGEFGLSPLAASKQRLFEFILRAEEPLTLNVLWAVMHKEMKQVDFQNCLADLVNAGQIMIVTTNKGPAYTAKLDNKKKKVVSLWDELFPPGFEVGSKEFLGA